MHLNTETNIILHPYNVLLLEVEIWSCSPGRISYLGSRHTLSNLIPKDTYWQTFLIFKHKPIAQLYHSILKDVKKWLFILSLILIEFLYLTLYFTSHLTSLIWYLTHHIPALYLPQQNYLGGRITLNCTYLVCIWYLMTFADNIIWTFIGFLSWHIATVMVVGWTVALSRWYRVGHCYGRDP